MGLQMTLAGPTALLSKAVPFPVARGDGKLSALVWQLCWSFSCVPSL